MVSLPWEESKVSQELNEKLMCLPLKLSAHSLKSKTFLFLKYTGCLIHYAAMMMLNRYFLREEVSGKQQLTPRNFLELYNVITAMPTWMLRNKMLLMCKLNKLCSSLPCLLFSEKNIQGQGVLK